MAWWIFQSLVTTAALAALVAVVCRFGRLGPVARHALWVLVLVKFVMPPLVVWPWAAPDPLRLARSEGQVVAHAPVGRTETAVTTSAWKQPLDGPETVTAPEAPPRPAEPAFLGSISVWTVFAGIWLAGTLCLAIVEAVRQWRLARLVRRSAPPHQSITRRVQELASELGVAPVPVVALAGGISPAVWCLGRPLLLWPADLRSDSQTCIDGIIVHELAHLKRRDHVVGWLELVAGLAWWWNPLFWWVRRALREQAELACDAWVISALPDGRRAYAESLLALSSPGAPAPPRTAAVLGVRASSRRALERRLVMIMNGRASLHLPSAGLLILALVAAATLPAWASAGGDLQHAPKPATEVQLPKKIQAEPKPEPVAKWQTKTTPVSKREERDKVQQEWVAAEPSQRKVMRDGSSQYWVRFNPATLTDEGKKLVEDYSSDFEAIQKEMKAKLDARRAAAIQALEALQEEYTKAGRLDEAVAIRDYLKAGGPAGGPFTFTFWKEKR